MAVSTSANEPELLTQLAKATNYFSVNLLKALPQRDNAFFSPFSIISVLGMAYSGAGGSTAKELKTALGFEYAKLIENDDIHQAFKEMLKILSCPSVGAITLNLASKAMTAKGFHVFEEYITSIRECFGVELDQVDFSSKGEDIMSDVNRWINEKSHGKIHAMLDEAPNSDTVILLLNALYFKAPWKSRFNRCLTDIGIFYNFGSEAISFWMMLNVMDANYNQNDELSCKALELPYVGDRLSMLFILPDALDGFETLEQKLTPEKFQDIIGSLKMTPSVHIKIPKFKLQQKYDLENILPTLGISKAFDRSEADFSGTCSENIYISKVLHKAFVRIDEEGTEASAATTGECSPVCDMEVPEPETIFYADHPFLFAVREKVMGMILFLGRAYCLSVKSETPEINVITPKKKKSHCACS